MKTIRNALLAFALLSCVALVSQVSAYSDSYGYGYAPTSSSSSYNAYSSSYGYGSSNSYAWAAFCMIPPIASIHSSFKYVLFISIKNPSAKSR